MGQTEGTQLVSSRTEGHISSQIMEIRGAEKKTIPEKELSITSSVKNRCFVCHDTSHNLEQCRKKYKHTTTAHQFGYATKYPFTMIQPSEETVQKGKFYNHCVLITSNLSNLDLRILKSELLKFWKLPGDWELKRECNNSFLVSFSSEDDVISCLKNPKMETLLDDKEVNLTLTRWDESDDGSLNLVEEWVLVSGVPRIYRNWKELYKVASAFGVLIDVDEESLEVGDKEPIRLKIASRSFDGAPFSYYYTYGWSSKLVMLTAVQDKTEGMKHKKKELEHKKELNAAKSILLEEAKGIEESRSNEKAKENKISSAGATLTNSKITTTQSSKPDGMQSIAPSQRSKIGEEQFRGIHKQNKELDAEPKGIEESSSNGQAKENKLSAPADTVTNSEKTATECLKPEEVQSIGPSPQRMIGEEHFRGIEKQKKELNAAKSILLLEEPKGIEESSSNGKAKENKISAPIATITNSVKAATESSKPEAVQSIGPSPRSMIGEERFIGLQKPPIKHVYQRRGKKQQVTEAINKFPSNKVDKEVAPHSSCNAPRSGASTGCDMLKKDCSKLVPRRELNMEEITPVGESKKAEKLGACRDTEYNNVAAPTINLKKTQILGDTSRTPRDELITKHTKGVGMDQMGSGVQVHEKEDASKIDTRLLPNAEEVRIYESFSEMGLHENLLKGIYQYGLGKPSAVHQRGIVPLCKGFGVVHQSLSGITETICTGILQRLDYGSAECQALILITTLDLAQETEKVLGALGQFLGVTAQTCTGESSAHADQQTMSKGVQVLVGTPGCILDKLQRHALSPDHIRMLFLDEADELLTGGFKDQINNIILHLPKKIQVGLFSAIYSNEAIQTSRRFDKLVSVIVPREEELKSVKQYFLAVENEILKLEKLYALLKATGVQKLIIFVDTKDKALSLAKDVSKHYTVSVSHDGMNQHARNTAIQKLKSGSSRILIATDHRGTYAMPQVPMVINYDLPIEFMRYIRRLQQQNREFRQLQSVAINLVTPADRHTLAAISRFCNASIGELPSDM